MFRPFNVKIGRSSHKRWITLFTCHASRSVHLEIVHTLEASSFINAVRRLQCRRGKINALVLDNATTHHGADRELAEALAEWNRSDIGQRFIAEGIKFQFLPPKASHFGGAHERLIRSCREHLRHILDQQRVTEEALHTIVTEVENIVNSRPLVAASDDPEDYKALTPNDLLVLRPMAPLPPGLFDERDRLRHRWRQVQLLSDNFWRRFRSDYMHTLHRRQKWIKTRCNLRPGDLVLLHEDSAPRSVWPTARVVEVFPSSTDDLVRSVMLKTSDGRMLKRPIAKLCLLQASDD